MENRPSVFLLLVAILSPWLIVFLHLCHLRSTMMEILVPGILLCIYEPLVRRASTPERGWIKVLLGLTTIVVAFAYLTWLHTESFPRVLLDKRSREAGQRIEEAKRKMALSQPLDGPSRKAMVRPQYPGEPGNARYPVANWVVPTKVEGDEVTLEGYVQVDPTRLLDVRAKEFNGNYFIGSEKTGGRITPIYASAFEQLSKLVGERIRITGKVRNMKSGSAIQMEELTVLKKQPVTED